MYKTILITISTPAGEVLEQFAVSHFRTDTGDEYEDEEAVGSRASESLLMDRIARKIEGAR